MKAGDIFLAIGFVWTMGFGCVSLYTGDRYMAVLDFVIALWFSSQLNLSLERQLSSALCDLSDSIRDYVRAAREML